MKKIQTLKTIAIACFVIMVIALSGCSSGGIISFTGGDVDSSPSISLEEVKILHTPPAEFETMGMFEEKRWGIIRRGTRDRIINDWKSQAAAIGANAVLVRTESRDRRRSITIEGYVIYVIRE